MRGRVTNTYGETKRVCTLQYTPQSETFGHEQQSVLERRIQRLRNRLAQSLRNREDPGWKKGVRAIVESLSENFEELRGFEAMCIEEQRRVADEFGATPGATQEGADPGMAREDGQ